MRLLAVAHYNKGAEEKAVGRLTDSVASFKASLHVCEERLPSGDPLTETVRSALARAFAAAGMAVPQRHAATPNKTVGEQTTIRVTPLKLSMLGGGDGGSEVESSIALAESSSRGGNTGSVRSMPTSHTASVRTDAESPRGVPQGNYAAAARKSARGGGGSRALVFPPERGPPGESIAVQTTFSRALSCGRGGRPPKEGSQRGVAFSPDGRLRVSRADVLGIVRGCGGGLPGGGRYLPGGNGLVQYEERLVSSMRNSRDEGVQVVTSGGGLVREAEQGGRRRIDVDAMIFEEAHNLARRGMGGGGGRGGDRTYKKHLERTMQARDHLNLVANVVQRSYRSDPLPPIRHIPDVVSPVLTGCLSRCHLARDTLERARANPTHLRDMYVRQIHSIAALIQSNVRVMLARQRAAMQAGASRRKAEGRRRERRHQAALRIQAFALLFLKVGSSHDGPAPLSCPVSLL